MSKRIFTQEEQEMLRANPAVRSCSARSVAFTSDFKKEAIRKYSEGKTGRAIFTEAGIPLAIIGNEASTECIRRWRSKTPEELTKDNRGKHDGNRGGRPPKEKIDLAHMSISEQLEYYKTKSAFDDLKLAFFAQARGVPKPVFRYHPGQSTK